LLLQKSSFTVLLFNNTAPAVFFADKMNILSLWIFNMLFRLIFVCKAQLCWWWFQWFLLTRSPDVYLKKTAVFWSHYIFLWLDYAIEKITSVLLIPRVLFVSIFCKSDSKKNIIPCLYNKQAISWEAMAIVLIWSTVDALTQTNRTIT